jgi:hypothetical protein
LYRLNREHATWELVDLPDAGMLYGADGKNLVFASWPDMKIVHLAWFPQGKVIQGQALPAVRIR